MDFELAGNYPIIIDGKETGTIDVSRDGLFWSFEATSEMESGIIRLSVFGDEGEGYLGVMEPRENRLRLKKKLSRSALSGFPQRITHAGRRGERHTAPQSAKEEPPAAEVQFEELPQSETSPADKAPAEKAPADRSAPPPEAAEKPEEDKSAFTPQSESDYPDRGEEKPPEQENPRPPMIVHRPNPGVSKPGQQRSPQQRKAAASKQEKATASRTAAQKLSGTQKQEVKPEDVNQASRPPSPEQEPGASASKPEAKAAPKPEKAAAPRQEKKPAAAPAQKQNQQSAQKQSRRQAAPRQEQKPAAQPVQKPEEDASKALVWKPCGCPAAYLSTMIGKNLFGAQKNVMEAADGEHIYLALPEETAELTDSQRKLFSSEAVIMGEKHLICKIKNGIIE